MNKKVSRAIIKDWLIVHSTYCILDATICLEPVVSSMLASRSWEIALLSSWGQGSHKGDAQCNRRSDGTRVPCYKDPMYAPSSSLQLVTRERDFQPRNVGAARKLQAFPLEHELSTLRNACGQDLDLDRAEEDPRWQRARRRRERGTFYWIIWTIVRGTCDSSFVSLRSPLLRITAAERSHGKWRTEKS